MQRNREFPTEKSDFRRKKEVGSRLAGQGEHSRRDKKEDG